MPISALLLFVLAQVQEPDAAIRRDLGARDPGARRQAAEDLADLGAAGEAWLLAEMEEGSPKRRRSLLLAAALLGSPESLEALQEAARPGSRESEVRAYALLLYGAFHPDAPAQAAKWWRRLPSEFEGSCLLAGLLAQASELPEMRDTVLRGRRPDPSHRALLLAADLLATRPVAERPEDGLEAAVRCLGSVLPGRPSIAQADLEEYRDSILSVWVGAARRATPRSEDELLRVALSGAGGGVGLALCPDGPEGQQAVFEALDDRVSEGWAKAWLWGAAGDSGLRLPVGEQLPDWEVAGLLRLALADPEAAAQAAEARRAVARRRFAAAEALETSWPAAVVLALAPEAEDVDLLRQRVAEAGGEGAQRLHPIWQLASGRTATEASRSRLFHQWSRELGAGYLGFLDREGPRWTAYLLVSGTRAAVESAELSVELEAFEGERDHALDSELYSDLLEFLLSGSYRWDLD